MKSKGAVISRLLIEVTASPEQVSAVERVFAEAGFDLEADPQIPLSGGPPLPVEWVIQVTLAVPIAAFFAAFAAEAGKDAYGAFSTWFKALVAARGRSGQVTLWVEREQSTVVLPATLSDEAVARLRDLDWSSIEAGAYIDWDFDRVEWQVFSDV